MIAFGFICFCSLFVFVNADDAPIIPLPRTLSPTSYHLAIDINLPNGGAPFVNATSSNKGTVTIKLRVTESTDTIVLNGANITITKCQLLTVNGRETVTNLTDIVYNNVSQLIAIKSTVKFSKGEIIQIKIEYTYLLRIDPFGLFKFAYSDENVTHHVAATQFETMYARRMVPCFDDPSFRSKWTVEVKAPIGYTVLSNTEQASDPIPAGSGIILTRFKPTPPIPSYLLAIAVHDYPYLENVTSTGIPYRFYGQQSKLDVCLEAFDFTGRLIDHLIERFKVVKFPSTKVDFIETSLVKGLNGMENVGLVTFNKDTFCNMESGYFKTAIIHELVHQWFGNIVTIKDWSNIAVKEGLTTYFTELVTRKIIDSHLHIEWLPALLMLTEYAVVQKPVIKNITSFHDVPLIIGSEQYIRAPFFMGMISQLIGPANFDNVSNTYLKQNAYGWGTVDMFLALADEQPSNLSLPVSKIMKPYFTEVGYPVIFVEKHFDGFTVTPLYAKNNSVFNTSAFIKEKKDFYVPVWYQPSDCSKVKLEIVKIGKSFNISSAAEVLFINPAATSWSHTVYANDLVIKVAKSASSDMQHFRANLYYELSNYSMLGFGGNFTLEAVKILKPR